MSSHTAEIGIIGGTGLAELPGITELERRAVVTAFGAPSSTLVFANWHGKRIVFLPRHGQPHTIPPHKVNYRANIWALKEAEVKTIIACNAVGGIYRNATACDVVIPHQLVDYTHSRAHTFFEENLNEVVHIDFTHPFTPHLREKLIKAAEQIHLPVIPKGTYAAAQGPRLETAAEIDKLERDGCDIVGMTAMPEAALAREAEIDYACIALVVNKAAGRAEGPLSHKEIEKTFQEGKHKIVQLLDAFIQNYPAI